jgi:hypothetical protein
MKFIGKIVLLLNEKSKKKKEFSMFSLLFSLTLFFQFNSMRRIIIIITKQAKQAKAKLFNNNKKNTKL